MSEKPRLAVQESYLQITARLPLPSLRLVCAGTSLADRLLTRFTAFGAQLGSLSMDLSSPKPADRRLTMVFLGGYATVQVSPLGTELYFRGPGGDQPNLPVILPAATLTEILQAAGSIVEGAAEQSGFDSYTFELSAHGRLHGQKPSEILGAYVNGAPPVFGELQKVGVRYDFKPSGTRLNSWIIAEPSVKIIPDGLFFNGAVTLDGREVELSAAADEARNYLRSVLSAPDFPLEVDFG